MLFNSLEIVSFIEEGSISLSLQDSVLSSAYKVNLKNGLDFLKSLIKIKNKRGPRIEPWGIPWLTVLTVEYLPFTDTYYDL